jgi:hypothetical protein
MQKGVIMIHQIFFGLMCVMGLTIVFFILLDSIFIRPTKKFFPESSTPGTEITVKIIFLLFSVGISAFLVGEYFLETIS